LALGVQRKISGLGVRMGDGGWKMTDITALPHALPSFVFAFAFLALLGSEIVCNLSELSKESFLV